MNSCSAVSLKCEENEGPALYQKKEGETRQLSQQTINGHTWLHIKGYNTKLDSPPHPHPCALGAWAWGSGSK